MIMGHNCEYYVCWCKTDPKCLCVVLKKMYTVDTKAFSCVPWNHYRSDSCRSGPVLEGADLEHNVIHVGQCFWTHTRSNIPHVSVDDCYVLLDALTVMCTRFMQLMSRSMSFQLWPFCFYVMLPDNIILYITFTDNPALTSTWQLQKFSHPVFNSNQ